MRKGQKDQESGGARVVEAEKKLIICAVKKPVKLSESPDGERRVRFTPTALQSSIIANSATSWSESYRICCA